ncbi:cache domain-containing protein [Geminicoccaceae bacterium SYSU G07066]|uniref:Cache domain-containing protein n=1 Tax=Benzoatithermus flavus TaxID=3108223 RepID=A0ABU8XT06_9PROT
MQTRTGGRLAAVPAALIVRNEYRVQKEKAEITTSALARAFEESVLRFMKDLDRLAQDASRLYLQHAPEELPALFRERASLEEAVLQVSVIGPDGRLVTTSLGMEHAGMDLSDREHFRYHARGGGEPVFISDPLIGRASKRWSVQFTRRIGDAAGRFAGVLVISVDIDYFNGFYHSIHLGPDGAITIIKTNGIVLGRSVEQDRFVGQRVSPAVVPGMLERGDAGRTVHRSRFDRVERITAWRKIPGYPVLVTLGESTASALASAGALAWRLGLAAPSAIAVLLVVGSLSRRMLITRALARRAKAALQTGQRERAFLDSVLDTTAALVAVFDREGRLTLANKCFRAFAGEKGTSEGISLLARLFAVEPEAIDLDALPNSCDASLPDEAGLRRHISWAITTIRDEHGDPRRARVLEPDRTLRVRRHRAPRGGVRALPGEPAPDPGRARYWSRTRAQPAFDDHAPRHGEPRGGTRRAGARPCLRRGQGRADHAPRRARRGDRRQHADLQPAQGAAVRADRPRERRRGRARHDPSPWAKEPGWVSP